jgi:hypothetical protein
MTFAELTFYLFTGFNALRLFSFAPQIWRVAHDRNGASAISYWSWSLWIAANTSTGLYAFANLGDLVLTATNAVNALCCAVVIVLTAYKRRHLTPPAKMPGKILGGKIVGSNLLPRPLLPTGHHG